MVIRARSSAYVMSAAHRTTSSTPRHRRAQRPAPVPKYLRPSCSCEVAFTKSSQDLRVKVVQGRLTLRVLTQGLHVFGRQSQLSHQLLNWARCVPCSTNELANDTVIRCRDVHKHRSRVTALPCCKLSEAPNHHLTKCRTVSLSTPDPEVIALLLQTRSHQLLRGRFGLKHHNGNQNTCSSQFQAVVQRPILVSCRFRRSGERLEQKRPNFQTAAAAELSA